MFSNNHVTVTSTSNPCLRTVQNIISDVLSLNYSLTIDVDPVILLASSYSDTDRVPDCRTPDRVIVVIASEIGSSKYFAPDPLLSLNLFSVVLCTALIQLITRSGYKAAQQLINPIRNESLKWMIIRVSREVVGEEPGTESHLAIFHQGGVQNLSTALFSWQ